jgi:predicted SnoaL-like aldol condensation-catalyzing enzyme
MNRSSENTAPTLKDAAIDFLRLVAAGNVREAYDKYVGPQFRHHNQYFRGDAQSLMEAMEENAIQNPDKVLEVQRALQDGDLVAVHSRVRQNPSDIGSAVVHIFRFEGNLIAEAWDVGQAVEENSPNENGVF